MNKTHYINNKYCSEELSDHDRQVLIALIQTLTSDEVCDYFDVSFEQNSQIRKYILKKMSRDITDTYTKKHKKTINNLFKNMQEGTSYKVKEQCALSLSVLIHVVPTKTKDKILRTWLSSNYFKNRNRAFKYLLDNWNNKYREIVTQAWYSYHDRHCVQFILKYFSNDFLINNYKDLLARTAPYQLGKLFSRLGLINISLIDDLKSIDEITYCYILVKFNKKLSEDEAKAILKNNYTDTDRIGLLLWSFGKMGLWNIILEYDAAHNDTKD